MAQCPNCGNIVTGSFCQFCGQAVVPAQPQYQQPAQPQYQPGAQPPYQPPKTNVRKIVGMIIAVVVVIAVVAVALVLMLGGAANADIEPNNSYGQASSLSSGGATVNGNLDYMNDQVDMYRIEPGEGRILDIDLDVPPDAYFNLALYDRHYSEEAWSFTCCNGADEEILHTTDSGGPWYIKVFAAGSSSGSYTLTVQVR